MMNKDILFKIKDKEDRVLLSNTLDKYETSIKKNIGTYTCFLNQRNLEFVSDYLKHLKIPYYIYIPHIDSEKKIIYFNYYDDFISIYRFKNYGFSHKEILGTLFSIGYDDSMIGDIFIEDNYVYLTNLKKYDKFLLSNLTKINNYCIELEKVDEIINFERKYININLSLNSLRIDLFISKLSNLSRSKVIDFIKDKNIFVNYKKIDSNSFLIKENDIISIQSIGKFIIDNITYNERKQKYIINIRKYN